MSTYQKSQQMRVELPALPQSLLDQIGRYGSSHLDGASEVERLHRWQMVIAGIKDYTAAILADRERHTTLAERINALVVEHASLRSVAEALNIDVGYLSRLRSGEKTEPSDEVLESLGLRRIVAYELIDRRATGGA